MSDRALNFILAVILLPPAIYLLVLSAGRFSTLPYCQVEKTQGEITDISIVTRTITNNTSASGGKSKVKGTYTRYKFIDKQGRNRAGIDSDSWYFISSQESYKKNNPPGTKVIVYYLNKDVSMSPIGIFLLTSLWSTIVGLFYGISGAGMILFVILAFIY